METSKNITILKQSSRSYNPYSINFKTVENIKFFNSDGVVCSVKWFSRGGSNNDFPELHIPFKTVHKRKLDLTLNHGFTMKNEQYGGRVDVYLPIDQFDYTIEKNVIDWENDLETVYTDVLKINIKSIKDDVRLDENGKLEHFWTDLKMHELKHKMNRRFEPKDLGKKCTTLSNELSEITGTRLTQRDIKEILKKYRIVKKRQ